MVTILSENKASLLVVLQSEVLFPESDLLLWCLFGHCEGRHEFLYRQIEEMSRARDDAKATEGDIAVTYINRGKRCPLQSRGLRK